MRHSLLPAAAAAATLLYFSFSAMAQDTAPASSAASAPSGSASGPGYGPGMGAGMGGMGGGRGPAMMGAGPGGQQERYGPRYTPGWGMMTPQEQEQHRSQMQGAKTAEECHAILTQHRSLMMQRAKERGYAYLMEPARDPCEGLP